MPKEVLRLRGGNMFKGASFWVLTLSGVGLGLFYVILRGYLPEDEPSDPIVIVLQTIALVFGPVLVAMLARAITDARITVDEIGVTHESPLPDFGTYQNFSFKWSEVREARLADKSRTGNPLLTELIVDLGHREQRIIPWQWVRESENQSIFTVHLPVGKKKVRQALLGTALVDIFRAKGLFVEDPNQDATVDPFDRSRSAQVVAGLFVALVMYFIVDEYVGLQEFYVDTPPYHFMGVMGLACGLVAFKFLPDKADMIVRSRVVACLFGVSVAMAAHPALLRVNAWGDDTGLQSYQYERHERGIWESLSGDSPTLDFGTESRYWNEFEVGDRKTFEIRSGPLGFHQINMAPLYKEQRAYYEQGIAPVGATTAAEAQNQNSL